ncbi:MAG: N-acetyltransferase [Thermoproteales archaeon]|nr:N-acetyltransferase [Thermoproteales archaeon]
MGEEYEVLERGNRLLIRLAPGKFAFLEYRVEGNLMYIDKTYTPPEFRGRGIAGRLMKVAVKKVLDQGLKIVPNCSYARHYLLEKHPEYSDLVFKKSK